MKLLSRADPTTARATLDLFKTELVRDIHHSRKFLIMIPLGHLLRFVAIPLAISFIIQALIKNPQDIMTPLWLTGLTAIFMITSTILNDKGYTALFRHQERTQTRLLQIGLENIMNRSYDFFANQKVGTLAGDLMNYSRSYTAMTDNYFLNTNHLVISFVVSLVVIGFLAPILLIPSTIITALLIGLNVRNVKKRAPYRNKRKKLTSQLAGSLADIMGNQLLVRVFASEERESTATMRDRIAIEKVARKEIDIIERESMIRQTFLYTFQVITILLFIWLAANELVSIAGLVFTFTYLSRSTDAIFGISSIVRQYEAAFLDAAPIVKILKEPLTVTDAPHAPALEAPKGSIAFTSVDFSYPDATTESVFQKLDLTIPAGQRVGLAGHSGGGKTTLTKLLLRFSDIDGGEITIDGQNIATVTQSSLRAHIAYVPQEPYLFHRSLKENIAYGRIDATDEEILQAAKQAHALEFIEKLPQGIDTIVGERGVKLSGGQRQRVAIARALLKDAPILILDEATSALDSKSEKLIQASLEQLMQGRTSIVIAHRLSTIAKLDRIIVLENGKIVEDGSHDSLLAQKGAYYDLWTHQTGGFIQE